MKKLLIIAYSFPPLNNIASGRWAEMIPELRKEYEVFVVTPHCEGDLPEVVDSDHVFRIGTRGKIAPSEGGGSLLPRVLKSLAGGFFRSMRVIDYTMITWFSKCRQDVLRYSERIAPDYLVTTVPPFSVSLFGYQIKRRRPNVKWIVDMRDSVALSNQSEKNALQNLIEGTVDRYIVTRADLVITVSRTLAEILSGYYRKNVQVVYNGYSDHETEPAGLAAGRSSTRAKLKLYYAGRMYAHRERSLFLLVDALRKYPDAQLTMRLTGFDHKPKELEDQVARYREYFQENGIENVEILGAATRKVVHDEERKADVLVIVEDLAKTEPVSKGTLTGKLFEYLGCRAPILSVCRDDSEIGEILEKTGRGRVASDLNGIDSFLKELDSFVADPEGIARYSRGAQARKFIELVKEL